MKKFNEQKRDVGADPKKDRKNSCSTERVGDMRDGEVNEEGVQFIKLIVLPMNKRQKTSKKSGPPTTSSPKRQPGTHQILGGWKEEVQV